jgi:hypothetical protein
MISQAVTVSAPVLAVAARLHHHTKSIGFPGLPTVLLLVIILVVIGVSWARRHSRTNKHGAERSDKWPLRHSGRESMDERNNLPWQ